MGKKKDKVQKSHGVEKTITKNDKKSEKRTEKLLKKKNEEDIVKIVTELQENTKQQTSIHEEVIKSPLPRSCMTLVAHPSDNKLLMFGGEYFNGKQTTLYNDMFVYHITNNTWTSLVVPNAPAPRCSHQMVAVPHAGGQLWLFGGEFSSSSQSQYYHYRDLWVFHLQDMRWEKIPFKGGPSARSGHRMVLFRTQLILFGGFHDNLKDFRYFNDLWSFSLNNYGWSRLGLSGSVPSPRSGCCLVSTADHIYVYGGYRQEKLKKHETVGVTLTDLYTLTPPDLSVEGCDPETWFGAEVHQSGSRPVARSSCSIVATPGNRALLFGGVHDQEDEEDIRGSFFNDLYTIELEHGLWHQLSLSQTLQTQGNKRRRQKGKKGGASKTEDMEVVEMEVEQLQLNTDSSSGAFLVTPSGTQQTSSDATATTSTPLLSETGPSPRMNACLAIKDGVLFLYGGTYEEKNRQFTLADMYSLDLHKLERWNTLISCQQDLLEWADSSSGSDDEDDDEDDDDDNTDDDEDEEMELGDAPSPKPTENAATFFGRTRDYWMNAADEVAEKEGLDISTKQLKKSALKMAEEHLNRKKSGASGPI